MSGRRTPCRSNRWFCALPDEARLAGAFGVALIAVCVLTPLARRIAVRTAFYDHPVGYKSHRNPTPYLGGAAVLGGFLVAALLFADGATRFAAILCCAVGLGVLGTIDDRVTVRPSFRVLGELVAAAVLWAVGLGWSFPGGSGFEELVLTVAWVVGFTNAFNLMDNMDGAASTVAAACAVGIAGQALVGHDVAVAALALALAGACIGFLRDNLRPAAPARIFLGDGGSMPIGFIVAAAAMNIPAGPGLGAPIVLVGALLLAMPVLDTLLVVVSRTRRHVPISTAGRDHLTHRLRARLGSPRSVAAVLALAQVVVSLCAIAAARDGRATVAALALTVFALGVAVVTELERRPWRPVAEVGRDGAHRMVSSSS
jgi:UDP-GlcNAc:undecaprenyl-phosphate/decaprenyl-phosphate GlcNAc-1-phosphate transferase